MSIKKIAEKAGVSPATVSRVLNNPNYKCSVSGLRDKIWKTAIEMNYVPNEAARNLKKRIRCGRIGSCHQDIDVPGFLLLCGNAFFQIPGRLVGHIIHLDSCLPYLVPESGNRTFIIGIIQNSGNRRR